MLCSPHGFFGLNIFAKYAEILAFPFSMLVTYTDTINARIAALSFYFPFALAVFALYAWLAAALRVKGEKAAAWGLLWALAALLPVLNIIPISVYAAERLLYLPLAGLALVPAAAGRALRGKIRRRRAYFAAFGILFLLFALNIQTRLGVWRNDVSLWSYDVERNPDNFLSRLRLADALRKAGNPRAAYSALEGALETASDDRQRATACNELGTIYAIGNALDEAERFFREAAELDPENHLAFYNLAKASAIRGDLTAARKYLAHSLKLNGGYAPALELAGKLRKQEQK